MTFCIISEGAKTEMASEMSTPGNRIKAARALRGMKQDELAEAADMSVTHLCSIEKGKRPIESVKVGTLKRICGAMGLGLDYVVSGKPVP
jgi:transcriptional regulator with XRE-family HTH domain